MQIFNPNNPAGRLEYFALHLMLGLVLFVIAVWVTQSATEIVAQPTFTPIDTTTGELGEPSAISGVNGTIREFLVAGAVFVFGVIVTSVLSFLLVLRRLTDLGASFWLSLVPLAPTATFLGAIPLSPVVPGDVLATVIFFSSVAALLFNLWLLFGKGKAKQMVAPYGSNPYDPASWVPPAYGSGSTAVTFNGQQLRLPGEHEEAA